MIASLCCRRFRVNCLSIKVLESSAIASSCLGKLLHSQVSQSRARAIDRRTGSRWRLAPLRQPSFASRYCHERSVFCAAAKAEFVSYCNGDVESALKASMFTGVTGLPANSPSGPTTASIFFIASSSKLTLVSRAPPPI